MRLVCAHVRYASCVMSLHRGGFDISVQVFVDSIVQNYGNEIGCVLKFCTCIMRNK